MFTRTKKFVWDIAAPLLLRHKAYGWKTVAWTTGVKSWTRTGLWVSLSWLMSVLMQPPALGTPEETETFDLSFAEYKAEARQVCKGPVLRYKKAFTVAWFDDVVVLTQHGEVKKMDTLELMRGQKEWKRKEVGDVVWPIGTCSRQVSEKCWTGAQKPLGWPTGVVYKGELRTGPIVDHALDRLFEGAKNHIDPGAVGAFCI